MTPKQLAVLLLSPPPPKDVVIDGIFDFLLESGDDRLFVDVLHLVVQFASVVTALL